jgi:hypothetical protein
MDWLMATYWSTDGETIESGLNPQMHNMQKLRERGGSIPQSMIKRTDGREHKPTG